MNFDNPIKVSNKKLFGIPLVLVAVFAALTIVTASGFIFYLSNLRLNVHESAFLLVPFEIDQDISPGDSFSQLLQLENTAAEQSYNVTIYLNDTIPLPDGVTVTPNLPYVVVMEPASKQNVTLQFTTTKDMAPVLDYKNTISISRS